MSFQGTDGFTVFDRHGRLVFRVDNYSRNKAARLLLMDGAGNGLLSLKPQVKSSIFLSLSSSSSLTFMYMHYKN